ncbi:MAG: winged helix-turn-helix domain-containing protein [Rhizobiales bacterium]|nr:winged helix-turn-helix domain-containing protein [Hyphomicrobiales bacterium]
MIYLRGLGVDTAQDLRFGDLILDQTCLFAVRNGRTIQFTRNERALLRALTRNPHRLMRRGRLLDEIASESDVSDRNIDFLVNRLRTKLGDSAKSPMYIATQYGEGYVWIGTPSPATPVDVSLVIASTFGSSEYPFSRQASSLVDQLRDMIAAGVGADYKVVVAEDGSSAVDKGGYFLELRFHDGNDSLEGVATLRKMPSKRIIRAFRLYSETPDATPLTGEATRVSIGIVEALRQALTDASTGLGIPIGEPLEMRLHKASTLLSASNPQWLARGEQLSKEREQDPLNPDIALQWCMHLFARLVMTGPSGRVSADERVRIESEIEVIALGLLPTIEGTPLLMLTCAKLLYFINRGHLELAEDITERAYARTEDYAVALPIMGQLHYARGRFDAAVNIFDRGIAMAELGPEFHLHMRVLKCIALLAAGDRAALDAAAADIANMGPHCPPHIASMIGWTIAAADRALPPELEQALASLGPAGAGHAIEYLYFTSARHLVAKQARANVMGGLIAQTTRLYGVYVVPAIVLKSIGLTAA